MRIEAERNAAVEELHLTEALLAKDYFTAAVAQQPAGESDKELPATLRIIESHGDQVGISFFQSYRAQLFWPLALRSSVDGGTRRICLAGMSLCHEVDCL